MASAQCPECGNSVNLGGRPWEGQRLVCSNCDAELEVVNTDPLELDLADDSEEEWEEWEDEEEEADWNDDEWDEEEDWDDEEWEDEEGE